MQSPSPRSTINLATSTALKFSYISAVAAASTLAAAVASFTPPSLKLPMTEFTTSDVSNITQDQHNASDVDTKSTSDDSAQEFSSAELVSGNCSTHEDAFFTVFPSPTNVLDIMEQNHKARSEIKKLEKLIREKTEELAIVQRMRSSLSSGGNSLTDTESYTITTSHNALDAPTSPSVFGQLNQVMDVMDDLEDFSQDDGFNEDVADEYIRHVKDNYNRIPIVEGSILNSVLLAAMSNSDDDLHRILNSQNVSNCEKVIFVLKEIDEEPSGPISAGAYYSLLYFNNTNPQNKCIYHYDLLFQNSISERRRISAADYLIPKLIDYFSVQKVIRMGNNNNDSSTSPLFTDSALFTIDALLKIILNVEEGRNENGANQEYGSPLQFFNVPSQPDQLKIIIMSRYIVQKLAQVDRVVGRERSNGQDMSPSTNTESESSSGGDNGQVHRDAEFANDGITGQNTQMKSDD